MKPITPDEVAAQKSKLIPDYVIKCFNDLIVKNWNGYSSTILQKHIVVEISDAGKVTRQFIQDQKYLDVEPIFEEAGWNVAYDKPGYCEVYEAKFIFTKKKNK